MRQFDYSVLDQPITLEDVWAETRQSAPHFAIVVIVMFFAAIVLVVGFITRNPIVPIFFAPFIFGFLWVVTSQLKLSILLKRFALVNNLTYLGSSSPINEAGIIFNTGENRRYRDGLVDEASGWLLANFSYTREKDTDSQGYSFGVMRLKLPRNMPHVLLDSKKNNFTGRILPSNFSSGQSLQLEGNFNDYFSVYVPEGYQRDALYFLTPELMAILIDRGSLYDFEVVDDNLYVYAKPFDFSSKGLRATLQQWVAWAHYFGNEFGQNIQRYADERIIGSKESNVVSAEGKRLKKGRAWKWIVGGALFVAVYIAAFFVSLSA